MIKRLLVANRGEIACRVFRTCHELGIAALAVYSDADANARHVAMADESFCIGPPRVADSYLNAGRILDAARALHADAIHPGYGFLSENAQFARDVVNAGFIWIGPPPEAIRVMGDKITARDMVRTAGVPVVPGSDGAVVNEEQALAVARAIGFPVLLKASGGGGGIGIVTVHAPDAMGKSFATATSQARKYFGNPAVYVEKNIVSARHVEVQILGLNDDSMLAIGDRDCSMQRRHQKVLEEAPAPGLSDDEHARLHELACKICAAIHYRGAGTIEMIFDRDSRKTYFLEMNTRLQVEHPVTEMTTGIDLVAAQIAIADERAPDFQSITCTGHAIELRVCAETPDRFLPSPGKITAWREPAMDHVRVDAGYRQGDEVTHYYDSLMAKLCVWGATRDDAIERLRQAAAAFRIEGVSSTLELAGRIGSDPRFRSNSHDTSTLTELIESNRSRQEL